MGPWCRRVLETPLRVLMPRREGEDEGGEPGRPARGRAARGTGLWWAHNVLVSRLGGVKVAW